jgi:hypothetical protein
MKKITRDSGVLSRKYIIPPFSVMDARQGEWLDRKRKWLALGVHEESGREENLLSHNSSMNAINHVKSTGTSLFDPVLAECLIEWFCPRAGRILDPFAGGAVRGLVASCLERSYTGLELRSFQVAANCVRQGSFPFGGPPPVWVVGDSLTTIESYPPHADMILTCPPYGDLEVYSDDPADLSLIAKKDHAAFVDKYQQILEKAALKLNNNRFAAIVVSNYRVDGHYFDFVGATVKAFQRVGLHFYNDAVLIQPIGTLAMRADGFMTASRKLGKGHQNVLVFVKGCAKQATSACKIGAPEEMGYGFPTLSP